MTAGGMNRRRADRPSLHERIHGSPPAIDEAPQRASVDAPRIRHCWVNDQQGRQPGLLLDWRRTVSGWQGRVVHPVLVDGGWAIVEEWLPAELLEEG